jgi:hypothetical protein
LREFAFGTLLLIILIGIGLSFIAPTMCRDDTDGDSLRRSGLKLRTDARTGCQYIEGSYGGITPRLDGAGTQMGCLLKK